MLRGGELLRDFFVAKPMPIAEIHAVRFAPGRHRSRADDVGEEDGCEPAFRAGGHSVAPLPDWSTDRAWAPVKAMLPGRSATLERLLVHRGPRTFVFEALDCANLTDL